MDELTRHQLLRDRRTWLGEGAGLTVDRDGDLLLARVPAPADGRAIEVAASYPCPREVSGLAAGPCGALFVSDTAHDRVLFVDGLCCERVWLPPPHDDGCGSSQAPGQLRAPRGLALGDDALNVADSGQARIQRLALPTLRAGLEWPLGGTPGSIGLDAAGRLAWIDMAARRLHRLQADGSADAAFDVTLEAEAQVRAPLFVACDGERLLVSDAQAEVVFVLDASGHATGTLAGPAGWMPGALAIAGARCYVADASDGSLHVFDDGVRSGRVSGWRGPVSALAVGADGTLVVKPDGRAGFHCLVADRAFVGEGERVAGPFDAGEDRVWERAWIEADCPPSTAARLDVVLQAAPSAPVAADWVPMPAHDNLLATVLGASARWLWLRVTLSSASPAASPRLRQARAATAGEDYLDYLPLTYRMHDGADGFLSRWLRLLRGGFGRVEELLDGMPRVAEPAFVPPSGLAWLAEWLALELPRIADDAQRRALVAQAATLFARRGTPASIREFVRLHTGIAPAIVEAFGERRIWRLGVDSCLGFDTRLAPLDPIGMVLPDEQAGPGCCPPGVAADAACSPCTSEVPAPPAVALPAMPIGRAIVGESGPLAAHQLGLPLFAESAYRFCVVVDRYRVHDPQLLAEIARIVEREKPAHTDYRIEQVAPELRVGLQAQVGIDAIVGGDPPPLRLAPAQLGVDTRLPPPDGARVGEATLDGLLTLT